MPPELNLLKGGWDLAMPRTLQVRNLSFRYRGAQRKALNSVSFEAERGEFVVIMGPSGAGKSTVLSTLNGLIPHLIGGEMEGDVVVDGWSTKDHQTRDFATRVGMVFQDFETQLFSTNVQLEVAFGPENLAVPPEEILRRVKESLRSVGMEGFEEREPATLSGGEKQRLATASVLAMRPSLLCLDEPTSELDPTGREDIFAIAKGVKESGSATMIMAEHSCEEVLGAHRIILFKGGEIVAMGPPSTVLREVDLLRETGIRPIPVAEIFARRGLKDPPLNLEEGIERFQREGWRIDEAKYRSLMEKDRVRAQGYGPVLIDVRGLEYTYDEGIEALRGIELRIREGEFVAIVGRNGSGKTTLIKHFNGLLHPVKGDVRVEGTEVREADMLQLARKIGFVFQNPDHQIFAERVIDEVSFGPRNFGFPDEAIAERVERALDAVGLLDFRESDPFSLTKAERQRLAVASVLASTTRVIVLDEPTTGMDYGESLRMMELIRELNERGHTIIMVTHTLWLVSHYAHRVIVMKDGKIIRDGNTREVLSDVDGLREASLREPQTVAFGSALGNFAFLSPEECVGCIVP
jgi:energy-coupling factor transport system ATP-binding protein